MGKNICKNIRKNLSGNYIQKLLDHAKQSVADELKSTSKKIIRKTAESTCDLIDNKIGNKITGFSKRSKQNNSETITNEHDKEITKETPKERYISMLNAYILVSGTTTIQNTRTAIALNNRKR